LGLIQIILHEFSKFPHWLWSFGSGLHQFPLKYFFVVENGGWVIDEIGKEIQKGMKEKGVKLCLVYSARMLRKSIIHFGSIHSFKSNLGYLHCSNKYVLTVHHGLNGKDWEHLIELIVVNEKRLHKIIVSNSIMRSRMLTLGIPETKIALIPINIDLSIFKQRNSEMKNKMRKLLNIPEESICIGSFQKDGNGWGEGLEPKLIKGPDIFVKAVTQLSKKFKIHILLTGPARGYVKQELEKAGIAYTHRYLDCYEEVADYYHALDGYLVTSREEGGPRAIMESMATGVPVVSTAVGMAPDLIKHEINGYLVDVEDVNAIVKSAESAVTQTASSSLIKNGLHSIRKYDYLTVAEQYISLYQHL
jgi:glycosyltransferase involved in cell wall biosynthesis